MGTGLETDSVDYLCKPSQLPGLLPSVRSPSSPYPHSTLPEQAERADGEKVAGSSERNMSLAEWWSWESL